MKYNVIRNYDSFQQQVKRVRLEEGGYAIAKRIESDWSWWTLDTASVFERELAGYQLCHGVISQIRVLAVNREQREFLVEVSQGREYDDKQVPDLDIALPSLLGLLAQLRTLPKPDNVETLDFAQLQTTYSAIAQQTSFNATLLHELLTLLERWAERGYGCAYMHGDLHLFNVLQKNGAVVDLIDFEESCWGIAAFDGALLGESVLHCWGKTAGARFKKQYEALFNEELIAPAEWRRFEALRNWLVSCYVRQVASKPQRRKAAGFILQDRHEPILNVA